MIVVCEDVLYSEHEPGKFTSVSCRKAVINFLSALQGLVRIHGQKSAKVDLALDGGKVFAHLC